MESTQEKQTLKTYEETHELYNFVGGSIRRFKENHRGDEYNVFTLKRYFDLRDIEKANSILLKFEGYEIDVAKFNSKNLKTAEDFEKFGRMMANQDRQVKEAIITKTYTQQSAVLVNLSIVVEIELY